MKKILIVAFSTFLLVFLLSFTTNYNNKKIQGNGKVISKEVRIDDYTKIDISHAANLVYEQKENDPAYLRVEIDQNLEEFIILKVENGKLTISSKSNLKTNHYKVYTNSKKLVDINSSGATNVELKGEITSNILKVNSSGASKLNANNLQCGNLQIDCSGASEVNLAGSTNTSSIDISGASKLKAEQLQTKNLDIVCSGASSAIVFVSGELRADASGASNIKYKGTPQIIKKSASGASSISKK